MPIDRRGTIANHPPRLFTQDELGRVSTLLRAIFLALRDTAPHARRARTALRERGATPSEVAEADELADVLSVVEGLIDGYRVARGDLVELTYAAEADELVQRLNEDDHELDVIAIADAAREGEGANTQPAMPPPLPIRTAKLPKPARSAKHMKAAKTEPAKAKRAAKARPARRR